MFGEDRIVRTSDRNQTLIRPEDANEVHSGGIGGELCSPTSSSPTSANVALASTSSASTDVRSRNWIVKDQCHLWAVSKAAHPEVAAL
jgi:hypothetical protein